MGDGETVTMQNHRDYATGGRRPMSTVGQPRRVPRKTNSDRGVERSARPTVGAEAL